MDFSTYLLVLKCATNILVLKVVKNNSAIIQNLCTPIFFLAFEYSFKILILFLN